MANNMEHTSTSNIRSVGATMVATLVVSLLLALAMSFIGSQSAHAAGYDGARLIDNHIFIDGGGATPNGGATMSRDQIQSFLALKGSGLASRSFLLDCYGPDSKERQWYTAIGAPCDQAIPASHLIYWVARIYGINPQVILATLQKEQSLITSPNPTESQINKAMGYNCPTTGSCSSPGFFLQLDSGAWVLRFHYERARGNMTWWRTDTSWTCGTEKKFYKPSLHPGVSTRFYDGNDVHYRTYDIANAATSSLYCYTPHAYNNPQGSFGLPAFGHTGQYYSGSYWFVLSFNNWFGSTTTSYTSLDTPRWMEVTNDAQKKIPWTDQPTGETLAAGTHLYFADKILIEGKWFLRTSYDRANSINRGFSPTDLSELAFEPFGTPRFMETSKLARKYNPRTGAAVSSEAYAPGRIVKFTSKMLVNGIWFYRSEFDESLGAISGFYETSTRELSYKSFQQPRYMEITATTNKINPATGTADSGQIAAGTQLQFASKTLVNGVWYFRTSNDTAGSLPLAIASNHIKDIPYEPFGASPKWLQLTSGAQKKNPASGAIINTNFPVGLRILIADKISVNGQWFYRTKYDKLHGLNRGFTVDAVEEIPYISLENPREMQLRVATTKINPKTQESVAPAISAGTRLTFSTKIQIDGEWYLRTEGDTTSSLDSAIPATYIEEVD